MRMCAHLCVNEHVGVCTIVKYSFPVYCVMYKNVFFPFTFSTSRMLVTSLPRSLTCFQPQ